MFTKVFLKNEQGRRVADYIEKKKKHKLGKQQIQYQQYRLRHQQHANSTQTTTLGYMCWTQDRPQIVNT